MTNKEMKQLESDVRDLLNQALVKLQNVEVYNVPFDADGYLMYNEYIGEEDEETLDYDDKPVVKKSKQELYLGCVKSYLQIAVKDKDGEDVEQVERKYHTSTCY